MQKPDNVFVVNTEIRTKKEVSCYSYFSKPLSELKKQKETIIRRYIAKVYAGIEETDEINEYTGLPEYRAAYKNGEVCDFEITTYELYDYREPIIQIKSDSYFIPFLLNLLIIGYVWRFSFMLIVWSFNIISKE